MQMSVFALAVALFTGATLITPAFAEIHVREGTKFPTISSALAVAQDGETILVAPGTYHEHPVVKRSVTLIAEDGEVTIDGDGTGTVLTIQAPRVTITGFRIRGSGRNRSPYMLWGDAGVAIRADNVRLEANEITDNESGILVWLASGTVIVNNHVHANGMEGILAFGTSDFSIHNNLVEQNGLTGIAIYKVDPKTKNDIRASARMEDYIIPEKGNIFNNIVRNNTLAGILLSGVRESIVENNYVHNNRKSPPQFSTMLQDKAYFPEEAIELYERMNGSGIFISCGAVQNIIRSNHVSENIGAGIVLYASDRNNTYDNGTERNMQGIMILVSHGNMFTRNQVRKNKEYGIGIPLTYGKNSRFSNFPFESGDNLIWKNDLIENRINAIDETSSARSAARRMLSGIREVTRRMSSAQKKMLKDLLKKEGRSLAEYERAMQMSLKKTEASAKPNRWDDGKLGNHYDDFDEPREGFIDHDRNGVGDRPHRIPGGDARDGFPLADGHLAKAENPFDVKRLNPYPGAPDR